MRGEKKQYHGQSVAKAMGRVTKRIMEIVKLAALAVAAGDGKSPTISFKNEPNCEVFEKT